MKKCKADCSAELQFLRQQREELTAKCSKLTAELSAYQIKYKQISEQSVALEEKLRYRDSLIVAFSGQIGTVQNQLAALSSETAGEERELREATQKVRSIARLAADIIKELDMLRKMSQLVEDIFVQTHILSILANVEVAEAEVTNEAGNETAQLNTEAFRVIAGEIKKLAADSSENVQTIKSNISSADEAVQKAAALTYQLVDLLQATAARAGRINEGTKDIKQQLQRYLEQ